MIGYVTVQIADTYIKENYLSGSVERQSWEALTVEDQEVILRQSFNKLERLPFVGFKTFEDQENEFPRYPELQVPQNICEAQIENAVALTVQTQGTDTGADYAKMRAWGIKSYRIDDLSETLGDGESYVNVMLAAGIISQYAQQLLAPYIGGGYRFE